MPKNQVENEVPEVGAAADVVAVERKQARVLVATSICGSAIGCGELVDLPADIADQLSREGVVDAHADAIAYAVSEGKQAITLPAEQA